MLFNDTLRYNISYGSPESTEYDVLKAARSAALGSLVDSLPLGLDTVVGELGVRLSGGEKQRVGYARCIIKNPSIILLDEASSSLVCPAVSDNFWPLAGRPWCTHSDQFCPLNRNYNVFCRTR